MVLNRVGGPLELVERSDPEAGSGEVIEVTACGVCHSDLHLVDGEIPAALPLVPGHEVTGVHPRLGPVMVYAPWGCGRCLQCARGTEMICADATEAGLVVDGGYADRMWVKKADYLLPLGDLDPVAAAPLACGGLTAYRAVTHALDLLRERGAQARAVVIGAGGLGQFAIRYLRLLSEARVTAVDLNPAKQDVARGVGAHHAVGPDELEGLHDLVLDFIGAESTLTLAAASVARRGMVEVIGLAGGRVPFGFGVVPHEARFMSSVWGARDQLAELLEFARREPVIIPEVETMPLVRAQDAHQRLRSGLAAGRIVLTMN